MRAAVRDVHRLLDRVIEVRATLDGSHVCVTEDDVAAVLAVLVVGAGASVATMLLDGRSSRLPAGQRRSRPRCRRGKDLLSLFGLI